MKSNDRGTISLLLHASIQRAAMEEQRWHMKTTARVTLQNAMEFIPRQLYCSLSHGENVTNCQVESRETLCGVFRDFGTDSHGKEFNMLGLDGSEVDRLCNQYSDGEDTKDIAFNFIKRYESEYEYIRIVLVSYTLSQYSCLLWNAAVPVREVIQHVTQELLAGDKGDESTVGNMALDALHWLKVRKFIMLEGDNFSCNTKYA